MIPDDDPSEVKPEILGTPVVLSGPNMNSR